MRRLRLPLRRRRRRERRRLATEEERNNRIILRSSEVQLTVQLMAARYGFIKASGGWRSKIFAKIDEDTNHSCKILHHLRICNTREKKNREREKLYTAREADQKSKRASLTDLY